MITVTSQKYQVHHLLMRGAHQKQSRLHRPAKPRIPRVDENLYTPTHRLPRLCQTTTLHSPTVFCDPCQASEYGHERNHRRLTALYISTLATPHPSNPSSNQEI
jgi:hypothetical protein